MRTTANALAVEIEEVPVSSNELLEANVVAIRSDLADLKTDFRTAGARTDEQFREVRQDIRELRAASETLRDKIDETHSSLDQKIETTRESLDKKIDATREALDKKIDATREALDKKIDTGVGELRADIKEIRADITEMAAGINDLKSTQKTIARLVKGLSAIIVIVGGGLGIAKTLGWI